MRGTAILLFHRPDMPIPTGCATRERLLNRYQSLLRHYTEELLASGKKIGFAAAEEHLLELRATCAIAREELHHHEAQHDCAVDAGA